MGDDATQTVRGGVIPVFGGSLGDVGENKGLCGELLHYGVGGRCCLKDCIALPAGISNGGLCCRNDRRFRDSERRFSNSQMSSNFIEEMVVNALEEDEHEWLCQNKRSEFGIRSSGTDQINRAHLISRHVAPAPLHP